MAVQRIWVDGACLEGLSSCRPLTKMSRKMWRMRAPPASSFTGKCSLRAIQHLTVPHSVAVQQLQQQCTPVWSTEQLTSAEVRSITSSLTAAITALQPDSLEESKGSTWQHWSGQEGHRHIHAALCCTSPRLPPGACAVWAMMHGCAPPAPGSGSATGQSFRTGPSPDQIVKSLTLHIHTEEQYCTLLQKDRMLYNSVAPCRVCLPNHSASLGTGISYF